MRQNIQHLSFWALAELLNTILYSFIHLLKNLIFLYRWIRFYYTYGPHFHYPFLRWRPFRLLLVLSYDEEGLSQGHSRVTWQFQFLFFLRSIQTVFQEDTLVYTPGSVESFPLPPAPTSMTAFIVICILGIAIWTGVTRKLKADF